MAYKKPSNISAKLRIEETGFSEIEILKTWFTDKESAYAWCGWGLRFPFTHESFLEDIHWQKMPSYSLRNSDNELLGFGQFYLRAERCHLARLAISPAHRGKGLGQQFISRLMQFGMSRLDVAECSLFVLKNNQPAIKSYLSLGFEISDFPAGHERYDSVYYMAYTR